LKIRMATIRRGHGGKALDKQLVKIVDRVENVWAQLEEKWNHIGYKPEIIQKRKNTVETCVEVWYKAYK